jgi:hypothetical protein
LLALLLALTLHVAGTPTRMATAPCQLVIVARVVEGGRQRVCLTEIDGFPAPNVTMHSRGTMTFTLRAGTISARVRITQRFRRDGRHAAQTTAGTIVGGTGRYRHARGTLTGSGTIVDTATRLSDVHLAYHLVIRASA